MTERKPYHENQRKRRYLGAMLRALVACPLCRGALTVVAYRERTTRLECEACRLRFSVDAADVGTAMRRHPEALEANDQTAKALVFGAMFSGDGPDAFMDANATPEAFSVAVRAHVVKMGETIHLMLYGGRLPVV